MIRLSDVRLVAPRPSPAGRSELLGGIDLEIRPGEYVALAGPNGAGKSLLLQLIAGLREPSSGQIEFDSTNGSARPVVGLVFQSPDDQIVGSTVERDLAFGLENRAVPSAEMRRRVDAMLEWSELRPLARRPPHLLSDGEKQRLALASALIVEPDLLLLDEPTARLDPIARKRFLAEVARVRETRGTTVVHVTHRASELAGAERLVALAEGRIVFAGDPAEGRDPARAEELGLVPEPLPPAGRSDAGLPAAGEPIVRAESVSFRADFAGEILRAVSMEIRPGERLGIVGPSGAGKTTLVSLLAGLLEPSAGKVQPRGGDRSVVGLVFQEPERAFFEASVLDDVAFGPRNRGRTAEAAREAAREALRRVGLDPEAIGPRLPETLSGGEARRAAIAGILAFAPEAVLFDEPTTGLDADGTRRLREILSRLAADGVASVMVSHDLPLVRAECDRVIVLREGEIAWEGPTADLDANLPPEWTAPGAAAEGTNPLH